MWRAPPSSPLTPGEFRRHTDADMKFILLSILLTATISRAQSPSFEAASIKMNNSGRPGSGISTYPARIKVINSTLKFCVMVAWNVKDFQVSGGGSWTDTERYDIDATAANPFARDEYRTMLQALLTDRFGLVIHRETHDKPGYVLVVARNGPKLPPPVDDRSVLFSRTPTGDTTLKAPNVSMKRFAEALSTTLQAAVVDQTGIEGQFDVSMQWTPDPASLPRLKSGEPAPPPPTDAIPGPSIFTALQEKLGLKLESKKVPVEVIFIDRANRPSEN
jgi:uncharacterized protein (TIGR03435 family)